MVSSSKFKRMYLMFKPEDPGYGKAQGPSGYLKVEIRDGKGKLYAMVQNLKEDARIFGYRLYLLKDNEHDIAPVCVGLIPMQKNKGEITWEFKPDDIDKKGNSIADYKAAIILAERNDRGKTDICCPLAAYEGKKFDWRSVMKEFFRSSEIKETKIEDELIETEDILSKYSDDIKSIYTPVEDIPEFNIPSFFEGMRGWPDPGASDQRKALEVSGTDGTEKRAEEAEAEEAEAEGAEEDKASKKIPGRAETEIEITEEVPGTTITETKEVKEETEEVKAETEAAKAEREEVKAETKTAKTAEAEVVEAEPETAGAEPEEEPQEQYRAEINQEAGKIADYTDNSPADTLMAQDGSMEKESRTDEEDKKPQGPEQILRKSDGSVDIDKLEELFDSRFEKTNPFQIKRRDYKWWKVTDFTNLNNLLYQFNIKTSLPYNPIVMISQYKYKHLILGIFTDFTRKKKYIVVGIPGLYGIESRPFGDMCRWAQFDSGKLHYGAFGYWLVFFEPETGKLLKFN